MKVKIFNQNFRNKLFLALLIVIVINFLFRAIVYKDQYLVRFNPSEWKTRYEKSQWVTAQKCDLKDPHINPKTCQWDDAYYQAHKNETFLGNDVNTIGDDGLYTYAGWKYIEGHDPTLLNAEVPPLGKYLIGLSILIFGNPNVFALASGIFALAAFFYMNTAIFKSRFFALLPIVIFSFEPLFYTQLRAPFLDLLYLGFLFLCFAFVLRSKFVWAAIALGAMISVKSTASTFVIVSFAIALYFLLIKDIRGLKKFVLFLPLSIVVLAISYWRYFTLGHTPWEFLGVQKYIITFYSTGAKGEWSAPWQMLLTGHWGTWFGKSTQISEWHLGWVIGAILAFIVLIQIVVKRQLDSRLLLGVWIIIYLLFLSVAPLWPRYLLLALPFLYNLAIWVLPKNILRH